MESKSETKIKKTNAFNLYGTALVEFGRNDLVSAAQSSLADSSGVYFSFLNPDSQPFFNFVRFNK